MKMPRIKASFLLVLAMGLWLSFPSRADEFRRSGVYGGLSGTFGISLFADQVEAFLPNNPKLGNSAGFQIRLGYRLASWIALEAQYEWLNEFTVTQTSQDTYESRTVGEFRPQTVTANLKLILPTGRIEPHVIVGLGVSIWEGTLTQSTISRKDTAFAARIGAGVDFHLTQSWVLNATGTGVMGTAEFSRENKDIPFPIDDLYYFSFSAGVAYRF